MSQRLIVSRRRLLQISGLAPLAALAASGASTAELAQAARMMTKNPPPDVTLAMLFVRAWSHKPGISRKKFDLVITVLWHYFQAGIEAPTQADPVVPIEDDKKVLEHAYGIVAKYKQKECGKLIAEKLDQWVVIDGRDEHEPATNACAYRCGRYARRIALEPKKGPGKINPDVFEKAYRETEDDMIKMLGRIPKQNDDLTSMGFGCG